MAFRAWWKKISYSHAQNSTWIFVMGIFRRTGMMEGGLLLPLTFQYLILMIWRACIQIWSWYLHWLENSKSLKWPCSAVLWKLSLETWQFQALPHSCPRKIAIYILKMYQSLEFTYSCCLADKLLFSLLYLSWKMSLSHLINVRSASPSGPFTNNVGKILALLTTNPRSLTFSLV